MVEIPFQGVVSGRVGLDGWPVGCCNIFKPNVEGSASETASPWKPWSAVSAGSAHPSCSAPKIAATAKPRVSPGRGERGGGVSACAEKACQSAGHSITRHFVTDTPRHIMAQAALDQRRRRGNPVRRWCFTINNPLPPEEEAVKLLAPDARYLICGREVGENGTPHLQGYVNLKKTIRMGALKARLGGRGHFEPARGDDCQNRDYCSKGGDILIEHGSPQGRGKRNDLHDAIDVLQRTRSLAAVAQATPEVFVKYHRGLAALMVLHPQMATPRNFKTEVTIFIGDPGCGKSRRCLELAPDAYWKPRGKWWDGYDGHEIVILDDFYGWLPFDELLRLCDRYPLRVETKGGTVNFVAKIIYITSNRWPHEWYSEDIPNKDALYRRITNLHFFQDGVPAPSPPPHFMFPHRINY